MKKLYQKIIDNNCHQCPECFQANGSESYNCGRTFKRVGFDDDNIPIPKFCPLKKLKEGMNVHTK